MKFIELWMIDQKIQEKAREFAALKAKDREEENMLTESYQNHYYGIIFDMLHRGEIKPY